MTPVYLRTNFFYWTWEIVTAFAFKVYWHQMSCSGFVSYLNLAVSGSISSSSLTGERGTLAENFSVSSEENIQHNVPDMECSTIRAQIKKRVLTYKWPHHWIIHLPHRLQWHPAVHVDRTGQWLKDVSHGLRDLDVLLLLLIFFRASQLVTKKHTKLSADAITHTLI